MKITTRFQKLEGAMVTPVTSDEAFRLMILEYIPRWNTPIVDLKNREIIFTATLDRNF